MAKAKFNKYQLRQVIRDMEAAIEESTKVVAEFVVGKQYKVFKFRWFGYKTFTVKSYEDWKYYRRYIIGDDQFVWPATSKDKNLRRHFDIVDWLPYKLRCAKDYWRIADKACDDVVTLEGFEIKEIIDWVTSDWTNYIITYDNQVDAFKNR